MKSLPTPDMVEPTTQHGHQDGQTIHDMAALPGPLAVQMAEPSNTVYQSWKDIADNSSDLSGYRNDHTASELPVQCSDQDGQIAHDMAALPGPLAFQMTETSERVYQSWRDIAKKNPSDLSGYGHGAASEPSIQICHQGGQTTHDMAALPGSLAFQMTEPSNTVRRSWRDIAENPSETMAENLHIFDHMKYGTCEVCRTPAYLECRDCACILREMNEDHNCPEECTLAKTPVLCDECEHCC